MTNRQSSRTPSCPICEDRMQRRQRRSGNIFWGCSRFPDCRGTRAADPYDEQQDNELQDILDYVYGKDDTSGDFHDDGSSEAKWYHGDDDPDNDP